MDLYTPKLKASDNMYKPLIANFIENRSAVSGIDHAGRLIFNTSPVYYTS